MRWKSRGWKGHCVYAILLVRPLKVSWRAFHSSGRGSAWLERLLREQEVGGSNPLAPTNIFNEIAVF
jgi:hypothetical protein